MRVLVACEFSGVVRDAFIAKGHCAWSCDLLPCEGNPAYHIQDDVMNQLDGGWDLMVAHPPCTHLCVSGARWFKDKLPEQKEALNFVQKLMDAPIRHIALENPISIISSRIRKPDQIIHPWQFGHKEMKTTCLWLKNLPPLMYTNMVGPPPPAKTEERKSWERIWRMPPKGWTGKSNRMKERSTTFVGIAKAMADQWGSLSAMSIAS